MGEQVWVCPVCGRIQDGPGDHQHEHWGVEPEQRPFVPYVPAAERDSLAASNEAKDRAGDQLVEALKWANQQREHLLTTKPVRDYGECSAFIDAAIAEWTALRSQKGRTG
jgi:hypothetical protein